MSLTEQELQDKIKMVEQDLKTYVSNNKHFNILTEYKDYLLDELKQLQMQNHNG